MMLLIDILIIAAVLFGLLYFVLAVGMLWLQRRSRRRPIESPASRPPIKVFKPLKGVDDQYEAIL